VVLIKLWNIVSTEIYTPYAGAAGMLLHINGKLTITLLVSSNSSYIELRHLFRLKYQNIVKRINVSLTETDIP
jgi:hypothetical protein